MQVFMFFLKTPREQACLRCLGIWFHILGAVKDLSPKYLRFVFGSVKKCSVEERRFLDGHWADIVFNRYVGNVPLKKNYKP